MLRVPPYGLPHVVPIPKGDGLIRLCGDYKVTINPELEIDLYPLPKPEELFAKLAGGTPSHSPSIGPL